MALSKNQNNLLVKLNQEISRSSKTLDTLKDLSVSHWGIKSFDSTFNALLHKGFVQHYTNHNDNSFLMTVKGSKKADTLFLI
jgi:hypothetical protein